MCMTSSLYCKSWYNQGRAYVNGIVHSTWKPIKGWGGERQFQSKMLEKCTILTAIKKIPGGPLPYPPPSALYGPHPHNFWIRHLKAMSRKKNNGWGHGDTVYTAEATTSLGNTMIPTSHD